MADQEEPSKGFQQAQIALAGKRWTPQEAEYLRQLILAGETGAKIPAAPVFTMRDALTDIEAMLIDVRRYRNMKAFPVTVHLCKKAANRAAQALGRILPFPDPHEID